MEQPDSIYFFKTTAKEKHCADEQKWKKKQNYRSNHSVEYVLLVEKEPDKLAKKQWLNKKIDKQENVKKCNSVTQANEDMRKKEKKSSVRG